MRTQTLTHLFPLEKRVCVLALYWFIYVFWQFSISPYRESVKIKGGLRSENHLFSFFGFWLLPMYLSMEVDSQIKSLENPCLFDSERSCGLEGEFIAQVFLQ